MSPSRTLAAVDLGSNSFRLLVGQVQTTARGSRIREIDSLKETVRLAGGLDDEGEIHPAAVDRGVAALRRFAQRLQVLRPQAIRAVATSALRLARDADHVRASFESALGHPIEVISGREEARLIYAGASRRLAIDDACRLVFDIGGGSTECMLGRNHEALELASAEVGCIRLSRRHFPAGAVARDAFEQACRSARGSLAPIARAYRQRGWHYAVGTSGTAKALCGAAQRLFGAPSLTREALDQMTRLLLEAGHVDRLAIEGIDPDRRAVLAGGLAAMNAVFDEFDLPAIDYCAGALRQGVLQELVDQWRQPHP